MKLLLDLGNTRLKWAWLDADGLHAGAAVGWDAGGFETALVAAWDGLAPQQVLAASVVDAAREARVQSLLLETVGVAPQWLRTPAEAVGVVNAYPQPQRLGVDRFLAMVAARAAAAAPCVLVGVGTALTLDALDADGRHLGGLIAPAPRLMEQAVLGATAQVRPGAPGRIVDAADNTADALHAGCWQAAAALVERFATRMAPALGGVPALRWSGGDAEALAALVNLPGTVVGDAVLQGLAAWAATS